MNRKMMRRTVGAAVLWMAAVCQFGAAAAQENAPFVTVCVLDSGCDLDDVSGKNFMDGSDDISDGQGHGTAVCTLVKELAPEAEIFMLKCFEAERENDGKVMEQAVRAAVDDYGADILLMSWAVAKEDEPLHEAIRYACSQGAVAVAASGNLSATSGLGSTVYPAAWDEVIGVGGVNLDESGQPAPSLWYLTGEAVYVCARADWEEERGTSYSAARIAGYLAAKLEEDAQEDAWKLLRQHAADLGESGYDTVYGWGYIDTGDGK